MAKPDKPDKAEKRIKELATKLALAAMSAGDAENFESEALANYCLDVARTIDQTDVYGVVDDEDEDEDEDG